MNAPETSAPGMDGTAMISIIIPTYNRASVLERAVRSVLNQEGAELEVIVVDDGSTDGTREVLESIGDPRVRYERLPGRSGACAARNRGIELARGDYIAFQDSDDEWLPGKLATQLRQLRQSGADVVFCALERYNVRGERLLVSPGNDVAPGPVTYEQLLMGNLCSTQTILGRRTCFEDVRFDPSMPRLQDWDMMLRMTRRYEVRYFRDVLVRLYEQSDSISAHPERLLTAMRLISERNGEVIRQNDRLAAQMAAGLKTACLACRVNPWRDYVRAMSPRLSLGCNAVLGLKAAYFLGMGLIHPGRFVKASHTEV